MNIGPGKEFDRLRAIFEAISAFDPDPSEFGDDCALIPVGRKTIAISIDAWPEAGIQCGTWLAEHGATAMIDISDGLTSDAQHLVAASEVGMEINLEQIPCWEGVEALAAAASGEEFELLLTMPPQFGDANASAFRAETGVQLTRIGSCLRGTGGRRAGLRLVQNNKPVPLPPGYDHFARVSVR